MYHTGEDKLDIKTGSKSSICTRDKAKQKVAYPSYWFSLGFVVKSFLTLKMRSTPWLYHFTTFQDKLQS